MELVLRVPLWRRVDSLFVEGGRYCVPADEGVRGDVAISSEVQVEKRGIERSSVGLETSVPRWRLRVPHRGHSLMVGMRTISNRAP